VRSLDPPGRVFATFIDHRGLDGNSFSRWVAGSGVRLERLDDVTGEFSERSRERAAAARRVLRARPARAGRFGLLLVLAEEAAVSWLIKRRRLRRWRFTAVRATSVPGYDPQGSRHVSAVTAIPAARPTVVADRVSAVQPKRKRSR